MKKSRAETTGALSGEFADRVRPPYASDEKRRQAAELFEHGIGYQRASRILDLPANTLRDWARAWRAGKFRTTISPIFGCRQTKSRAHASKRTHLA